MTCALDYVARHDELCDAAWLCRLPRRSSLVLAGIAVYFFIFWGRLPYVVATFIFLAGMMALFKAGAWWKILLIAGIATAVVWYVFGVLAMVPLP